MKIWLFVFLFSAFSSVFASLPDLKSLIANKNYSKAIQLGQQLQQQNPQSASILFYTALAYQYNKQPKRAKILYLSAIKQNSHLPEVYNNLANIYVLEKNYTEAAKTLTLAINSQENIATAYKNLSKIYSHLASQAYQQVLDDGIKKKKKQPTLNTRILASLDFQETIDFKPLPKIVIANTVVTKIKPTKKITSPSVKQTIIHWANSWQNKNYTSYTKSYAKNYAPKNLSHIEWLAQRKKRINRPGRILVSVGNFDIKINGRNATINFDQAYQSKTYKDKVRKRMHLALINNQWFITSEVTLSVL